MKFITYFILEFVNFYAILSYYLTALDSHLFVFTFFQVVRHDLTVLRVILQVNLSLILKDALGRG